MTLGEVADLRDHWECPTCGIGVCVMHGKLPAEATHGTCGIYELVDSGIDCSDDEEAA